jgi:hypothetical protein
VTGVRTGRRSAGQDHEDALALLSEALLLVSGGRSLRRVG